MDKAQLTQVIIAAKKAVAKIATYKVAPTGKGIAEVLAFQKLDPKLSKDGDWGPNTATAAKWYLQSDVPKVAAKFANIKITWTPPPIEADGKTVQPKVEQYKPAPPNPPKPVADKNAAIKKKAQHDAAMKNAAAKKAAEKKTAPKRTVSTSNGLINTSAIAKAASSAIKQAATSVKKTEATKKVAQKKAAKAIVSDSPKYGQDLDFLSNRIDAEEELLKSLDKKINPKLDAIKKLLDKGALQTQATAEHKTIVAKDDFQKQVISKLQSISDVLKSKNNSATVPRRLAALII